MVETEGAAAGPPRPSAIGTALEGWRARDPGLRATHRSIRAAVLVPAVFALADFGVGNGQTTLFSVFGSFSLLLFVDFGGPTRVRLRSYAGLFATGAVLIIAGTLCSAHAATAVIGMAVFGFAVLFAGVVSPQAAVASTAALLTFVLPVAVPAGASAIGSRLAGWGLAAAFCIPAVMLVWSDRWHDPLRRAVADAARAVAGLVETHADGRIDPLARQRAGDAMDRLRTRYEATPYRPAGAGPTDSALVSLVSRMEWVGRNALVPPHSGSVLVDNRPVQRIHGAVARVLRQIADLVEEEDALTSLARLDTLAQGVDELASAREASMEAAWAHLLASVGDEDRATTVAASGGGAASLWTVDPTYPSRMLAFATEMTADVALGTVPDRTGHRPVARVRRSLRAMFRSASSRFTFRSVWFRNSVRGAVGLSLAVAVAQLTDVEHGFWVVLGTLSVLRSNALGTGANALRAVAGTVSGFVVGSVLLVALGPHLDLLWAVLPFAVLVAGVAPSAISFAVGQAGFTVAVVIVFNIIDPIGWKVGLVRVEDVAIGVLVSVVVGLLFWPRGAAAELARSLSEAYAERDGLARRRDRAGRRAGCGDRGRGTSHGGHGQRRAPRRCLPTVHERAGRQACGPAGGDPPGDRVCPGPVDGADPGLAPGVRRAAGFRPPSRGPVGGRGGHGGLRHRSELVRGPHPGPPSTEGGPAGRRASRHQPETGADGSLPGRPAGQEDRRDAHRSAPAVVGGAPGGDPGAPNGAGGLGRPLLGCPGPE